MGYSTRAVNRDRQISSVFQCLYFSGHRFNPLCPTPLRLDELDVVTSFLVRRSNAIKTHLQKMGCKGSSVQQGLLEHTINLLSYEASQ